jgi:hypothetical protein
MIPKTLRQVALTSLVNAVLAVNAVNIPSAQAAPTGTLDGVFIEAVEPYPVQSRNEILLGVGLYPFNAYFNSFSFDLGFEHWLSRNFTWEVVNFKYLYSVDRGLTEELADKYGVNPETIERPSILVSTNTIFNLLYGKFVSIDQKIRYFKAGAIFGGGIIGTSQQALPALNIGFRFDCHVSESFSWKLEVRDAMAPTNGFRSYVTFHLGGGFSL